MTSAQKTYGLYLASKIKRLYPAATWKVQDYRQEAFPGEPGTPGVYYVKDRASARVVAISEETWAYRVADDGATYADPVQYPSDES